MVSGQWSDEGNGAEKRSLKLGWFVVGCSLFLVGHGRVGRAAANMVGYSSKRAGLYYIRDIGGLILTAIGP